MKSKDKKLGKRQDSILDFIEINRVVSIGQILEHVQQDIGTVTKMTISRDLEKMLELNLIERRGAGRAVTYQLSSGYLIVKKIDIEKYFSNGEK